MIEFNLFAGSHVQDTINKMIELSKQKNDTIFCIFNGSRLEVTKDSNPESVYKEWEVELKRKQEEYLQSPQYQEELKRRKADVLILEQKRDQLMISLQNLDISNLSDVLDWFCAIQEPSDHIDVKIDKEYIVSFFEKAGFEKNVNIGPEFNGEDKENYARYIIGQCLDNLSSIGAIHHMVLTFSERWKKKFY